MKFQRTLLAAAMVATMGAGSLILNDFVSSASATDVVITLGNKSRTKVITPMNAARFVAWATATYPTIPNPSYVTPCGSPLPACLPLTITNPEPVLTAIDFYIQGMIDNVLNYERVKAKDAVAEPSPIN